MDDLTEARRLMELVAAQAPQAGRVDARIAISMAKALAHISLAESARQQTALLQRIVDVLEKRNAE